VRTVVEHDDAEVALALARVCASEAGIRVSDDCAAIYAVIAERARRGGRTWLEHVRLYSGDVFNRERVDHRRWLAHLDASGEEPAGWRDPIVRLGIGGRVVRRQRGPWARPSRADDWQRRWLALLEHAGRIAAGEVRARCDVTPHHWGCPPDAHNQCTDDARARRAGWIAISCGETRNRFYCDPRASSGCRVLSEG
jgi:hypothetical protein